MWCCGVNVPKLRAIIATVRNFARAAFTTFGVVVFCLLMSRSSPFLFKLWSVQAMDTCIAPAAPRAGGGRTPGPARAQLPSTAGTAPAWHCPSSGGSGRAALRPRGAAASRTPTCHGNRAGGFGLAPGCPRRCCCFSQKHPSSQVLPERRSFMVIAPQAALPRRRLPAAGFKSLRASCERWLRSAKC